MIRTPRSSPQTGMAPRGTLALAAAGSGVLLFLFFLLPQLTSSRAAEARAAPLVDLPPEVPAAEGEARVLELVQPDPSALTEGTAPLQVVPGAPAPGEKLTAAAGTLSDSKEEIEAPPKLLRVRRGGRATAEVPQSRRSQRLEHRKHPADSAEAKEQTPESGGQTPRPNPKPANGAKKHSKKDRKGR